jgi:hypothetical protein
VSTPCGVHTLRCGPRSGGRRGSSPGQDYFRSVMVRMVAVATRDTKENRLALAVFGCRVAALAALLLYLADTSTSVVPEAFIFGPG